MTDKITNILEFYDSILKAAAHNTDVDGNVTVVYGRSKAPAKLGEKDLVIPTRHLLKNPDYEKQVFFHPLCEQITRYESEVFRYFKRSVVLRLVTTFATIGSGLLKLQEEPAVQRKMSIEQIEIIKNISTFDKSSVLNWSKMVMGAVTENPTRTDTWPISIFMKRNGEHNGKHYRRVASVSFPLLEKIMNNELLYKGDDEKSQFRTKDYQTFKEVIKTIFPNILDTTSEFNYGYNETLAPYLLAFLGSVNLIYKRFNYLIDLFKDAFDEIGYDVSMSQTDLTWADMLEGDGLTDLERFAKSIPVLKGNAGETTENGTDEAPEAKPVHKEAPVKEKEVKKEKPVETKKSDDSGMTAEAIREREEMLEKRRQWQKDAEEEERRRKEREERHRLRREEDEEYERKTRRDRDEDDTPPWEDAPARKKGGVTASELFGRNSNLVRGTRTDEEDYERERGRPRRRDERDERDYDRRDRDYDYRDRDRDYDRRDYRDRDRRDYDRRDDRDYDRRDDRGYGRERRRAGPWGR